MNTAPSRKHRWLLALGAAALVVLLLFLLRDRPVVTSSEPASRAASGSAAPASKVPATQPPKLLKAGPPTRIIVHTDAVSGEALSGVAVILARRAEESRGPDLWHNVGTCLSSRGTCTFSDVTAGTFRATATAAKFIPASKTVRVGGAPETVTLRLRKGGGTIRGIVVNSRQSPIAGAAVTATNRNESNSPDRAIITATTDAGGRFTLQLRESNVFILQASAPGYLSEPRHVPLGMEAEVTIVASETGAVGGTVRQASDRSAVAGAEVTAYLAATFSRFDTRTDERGAFAFKDLPAGSYSLIARRDNLRGRTESPLQVGGGARNEATILVDRGLRISGEVVASDGTSISDVYLRFVPDRGRAEPGVAAIAPNGTFSVSGLAPGVYEVSARAVGRPTTVTSLTLADDVPRLSLVMLDGTRLDGTVYKANGEPCAGGEVRLVMIAQSDKDRQMWMKTSLVTDCQSDGKYLFEGLSPGKDAHVVARCEGEESAVKELGWLSPGGNPTVDIQLSKAAVLTGTVVRSGGAPVPGAVVSWHADLQGLADFTGADGSGQFRIAIPARAKGMDVRIQPIRVEDVSSFNPVPQKVHRVRVVPGSVAANLVLELK